MNTKVQRGYFSLSLYKEALAQLALPGFLLAGILIAGTLLSSWETLSWYLFLPEEASFGMSTLDISEAWTFIPVYIWVAPFLLTVLAFDFLRSRKKSDYYHAVPAKRSTLFFSYTAAIVSWLIATVFIAMALGGGLFAAVGVGANWSFAAILGLEFLAAMLFALAIALLAVTLSGTLFSTAVLINVFLWLPLLAAALFRRGVLSIVPTLPSSAVSFFGLDANITLFAVFRFVDFAEISSTLTDAAWTLLIALAVFAAASFFFVRRKSEMAGNSAPSNRMQTLYRISVALPPLLLVFSTVGLHWFFLAFTIGLTAPQFLFSPTMILPLIAAGVIALISMSAFELISTRTWRNLLKVPLSFAAALAVSCVFVFSIWAVATFEASFTPSADEIEKVRIVEPYDPYGFLTLPPDAWISDSEAGSQQGELRRVLNDFIENETYIRDQEVITLIADELAQRRVSRSPFVEAVDIFEVFFFDAFSFDAAERLVVEIHTHNGVTRQRVFSYGNHNWSASGLRINELGEALIKAATD